MNMKIDLVISINGAKVLPTSVQMVAIYKAVNNIVFRETPELTAVKKLGRPLGTKNRSHKQKWSEDEIETHKLKEEGKSNKRVTAIINTMFHTNRTVKATSLMFWNIKTGKKIMSKPGILERVGESNNPFNPAPTVQSTNIDDFKL